MAKHRSFSLCWRTVRDATKERHKDVDLVFATGFADSSDKLRQKSQHIDGPDREI